MKQLVIYRALLYLFFPVAGLMAIVTLFMLFAALLAPSILLSVFLSGSVVVYVIASFIFLKKGIDQNRPCKASLRDWIRVNAIVAIIFSIMSIMQTIGFLGHPELLQDAIKKMMSARQDMPAGSEAMAFKMTKGVLYFFAAFSVLLFIHTLMSFRVVKQYEYLFEDSGKG